MIRSPSSRWTRATTTCALAACALIGCAKRPPPAPLVTPLEHDVIFSGCESIRVGPVCEVKEGQAIRVWLPDGERGESFTVAGKPVVPHVQDNVAEGALYELAVAPQTAELAMVVDVEGHKKSWSLHLSELTPIPPRVAEAKAKLRAGDPDGAEKILRDVLTTATGDERCYAVGQLGQTQAIRDKIDEAVTLFNEAIPCAESAGRIWTATAHAFGLVHVYLEAWRFGEARVALTRAATLARDTPELAPLSLYYRECISKDSGDARSALATAAYTEDAFRRVSDPAALRDARIVHAQILDQIGRPDEVSALLGESSDDATRPYERSFRLRELGLAMLLSRDLALLAPDPRPSLSEAVEMFRSLGNEEMEVSSLVLLARAALQANDTAAARGQLQRAWQIMPHPPPEPLLDLLSVEGDVKLADDRADEAVRTFRRLGAVAAETIRPDRAWIAAEGLGRSLLRLGRRGEALAAFAAAEARLDEASRAVPLGEGRDTYLALRETSARRRVDALLEVDPGAAFRAAREARRRLVTDARTNERAARLAGPEREHFESLVREYRRGREALEAGLSRDWALPTSELGKARAVRARKEIGVRSAFEAALASLPPAALRDLPMPAPGEVWIGYFPLAVGWAGFAMVGASVRAVRLAPVDLDSPASALSERLLTPFAGELARAKRIVLLPYAALAPVDFHALPFNGHPLVAVAPVEYSLDLGPADAQNSQPSVLVVSDPRDDLPAARIEARGLISLTRAHAPVEVLEGASATRAAVEEGLSRSALFYYAGHGAYGGRDGWDSALLLANGSTLSAGDILALRQVPLAVILSGCDTARNVARDAGERSFQGGLGIAQALLAAGANRAIATTRTVGDAEAEELVGRVYAGWLGGQDIAAALRTAQLSSTGATASWSAFRAIRR